MRWITALVLGLLATTAMAGPPALTPHDMQARQRDGTAPLLLDVRTPAEYRQGHIAGALNVPVDRIAARAGALRADRDQEIVVYCHSGKRAARARDALESRGYSHVRLLDGSILRWRAEHRPLVHEHAVSATH